MVILSLLASYLFIYAFKFTISCILPKPCEFTSFRSEFTGLRFWVNLCALGALLLSCPEFTKFLLITTIYTDCQRRECWFVLTNKVEHSEWYSSIANSLRTFHNNALSLQYELQYIFNSAHFLPLDANSLVLFHNNGFFTAYELQYIFNSALFFLLDANSLALFPNERFSLQHTSPSTFSTLPSFTIWSFVNSFKSSTFK